MNKAICAVLISLPYPHQVNAGAAFASSEPMCQSPLGERLPFSTPEVDKFKSGDAVFRVHDRKLKPDAEHRIPTQAACVAGQFFQSSPIPEGKEQGVRGQSGNHRTHAAFLIAPCIAFVLTLVALPSPGRAEEINLTLKETLQRASRNSPEVLLSEIEGQAAASKTSRGKAFFYPRLNVGSGLAATHGFPLSIEGSAPSIFEANFIQPLFDRAARKQIEVSRIDEEGAQITIQEKALEAASKAGGLYVELRNRRQKQGHLQTELESLNKVCDIIQTRAKAGVAEPRELTQARLGVARARLAFVSNSEAMTLLDQQLKQAIDLPTEAIVSLGDDEVPGNASQNSESSSFKTFLESDLSLMQLRLQRRSYEAAELALPKSGHPTVSLVGTYGLFSRFNNYDLYFKQFQRNNAVFGLSIQVPIFLPETNSEKRRLWAARDEIDLKIRMRSDQLRLEAQSVLANSATLQAKEEVAGLEAQLARENLQVTQAKYEQGRASLVELEEARRAESSRWIEYLDVKLEKEKSRLAFARLTGQLLQEIR